MILQKTDFITESEKRFDINALNLLKQAGGKNPFLLESPERIANRIGHLIATSQEPSDIAKERIIGKNDLMSINYLQLGTIASQAVCRIHVRNENGGNIGFGTGFLISPRLLITNNHVIENEGFASKSLAEFNYQYDIHGVPSETYFFELNSVAFFKTNTKLDYTIIAIEEHSMFESKPLSDLGFLKLYEEPAKAIITEHLSIIQHPSGGYKQIALRENQLIEVTNDFVWYNTDTTQGSSGSCVFNDQWQVVALHHSGVPKKDDQGNWLSKDGTIWKEGMDDDLIDWVSNEGVRISSILSDLKITHASHPLYIEMINTNSNIGPISSIDNKTSPDMKTNGFTKEKPLVQYTKQQETPAVQANTLTFTVPIEISIKVGTTGMTEPVAIPTDTISKQIQGAIGPFEIKKSVDPNYTNRNGYDSSFITRGNFKIELTDLLVNQVPQLAPLTNPTSDNQYLLHYYNFSVAINKNRKLCALTAVNIDGSRSEPLGRENNPWIMDPRIDEKYQTGPLVYANNDLDRGHMVRRLDPVWGPNAQAANDDTFHFANSTPQHKKLNQITWLSLENYILSNLSAEKIKASVFTGPVFGDNDIPYRGVLLPLQFWKIAVIIKSNGEPSVTGYMLCQPDDIEKFRTMEGLINDDGFGQFKTYQVPIKQIATLTGLAFDRYIEYDPLNKAQITERSKLQEIRGASDIVL